MNRINRKQIVKTAGILLAGLFLGWLLFGGSTGEEANDINQHIEEAHTDEEGNIVYTCSMHPQIRRNEPGNCPICGMELIPAGEADKQGETTFTMTEAAVKLADIQTTRVERRMPEVEIRLPGRVAADERRVSSITAHFSGRIDELYVDFTGTYVKEGEKLASIYSPELISAQRELLEAAKNKETDPELYESTRRKMRLWGLPESQIQRIEASGNVTDQIPIVATRSGYIIEKNVDAKDYVNEGTVMYKVADFSRLWVLFDAYETDLGVIDRGDSVEFTVRSHPGEVFEAEITYIDPFINPETRTARVRAEVDNPGGTLKPDMLARGTVNGTYDDGEKLVVPRSAVMWTGKRSIVFVEQTDRDVPTFEPREVILGHRAGDYYVIEEGLEEGEQVVTHGNFKLDSAAQLADKLSMMNREPGSGINRAGHDHGDEPTNSIKQKLPESGEDKNRGPAAFGEQLNELTNIYLDISAALNKDEVEAAISAVQKFRNVLASVDMRTLTDSGQMNAWMEQQKELQEHAEAMLGQNNLDSTRNRFAELSDQFIETITRFELDRTLYIHYCPMAVNNQGAHWISEQESIDNPYMGQEMTKCGNTVTEINTDT